MPSTLGGDALEALRLVREDDDVGALGELDVGVDDLAADRSATSASARGRNRSWTRTGSPQPSARAVAMFPAPMMPICMNPSHGRADFGCLSGSAAVDSARTASAPGRQAPSGRQDWLKKPFSMSSAFSSAEICTLRGVSMKTLWAMRCMPPSSA